jgi:hypothetical protein
MVVITYHHCWEDEKERTSPVVSTARCYLDMIIEESDRGDSPRIRITTKVVFSVAWWGRLHKRFLLADCWKDNNL